MRPVLQKILRLLPTLTPDELAEVGKRLTYNRQQLDKIADAEDDDWLFAGIVMELKRRGILAATAKPAIKALRHAAPHYQRQAKEAREALAHGLDFRPTPPDLLSLGALAARSLADDLTGGPAPICLQVMVQNVQRVVGAVDRDYPDYIRYRQLGFVVRRKKAAHGPGDAESASR